MKIKKFKRLNSEISDLETEKPKLWIFGDSFADEISAPHSYAWPKKLRGYFNVKNFAVLGTGPDWSLMKFIEQTRKYGEENLKDINVLFLISGIYRFNFSFFDPKDQVLKLADLYKTRTIDRELVIRKSKYEDFSFFYNDFMKYFIMHGSYPITEQLKIISYLQLWSKFFKKMLVWNIFENDKIEKEVCKFDLSPDNNEKFCAILKPLSYFCGRIKYDMGKDLRANHLDCELHPIMVKCLTDFFVNDKPISFEEFKPFFIRDARWHTTFGRSELEDVKK